MAAAVSAAAPVRPHGQVMPDYPAEAARALADELRGAIEGEVRFDAGSRALYARDAGNYRQVPIGVVIPRSTRDVVVAMSVIRRHGAPVTPRGGGTALAGQTCNTAVVIDNSKYLREVLEIDTARRVARVQPGVPLDVLRNQAEQHHLTFGPDPATHAWCTLGGMIGNNSCGVHSVMAGKTSDNVEELDVLTYDGLRLRVGPTSDEELERLCQDPGRKGDIYRSLRALRDRYADQMRDHMPHIPRRVSGYNIDQLLPENGFNVARALVGTEGTCVNVLEATVRLVDSPPARALLVLGYPDVYSAADDVPQIMEHQPVGLEAIDHRLVEDMEKKHLNVRDLGLLPDGRGWLLVEFGGDNQAQADERAHAAMDALKKRRGRAPSMMVYDDRAKEQKVWQVRESGLGATAYVPGQPDAWPGWEDSAVPPDRLGGYLRDLRALFDKHGYQCSLYGHFGQGCVHTRIDFALGDEAGVRKYREFMDAAADLVVRYGGSLSGEHGDGQARAELLPKMYGDELVHAFGEFKAAWDPQGRMNPGKVVDPYPITSNLTLQAKPRMSTGRLHFRYPDDGGGFEHATLRCVGVGKCRDVVSPETMCPSYQVLKEEKHTTRGRAHLLHEMLVGQEIEDGWQSEEVKEALDLCLGCKGCKGDCPVNVDMATYKAEFMSHYYAGRVRPRSALAFGLIFYWARVASLAPGLVNFAGRAPVLGRLARAAVGMDQQRQIPTFGRETFKSWFFRRPRPAVADDAPAVVLWPDTFNNYLEPRVAQSAVAVLEAAGRRVIVPQGWACCGRPVYDFGMLDVGERLLTNTISVLRPYIADGTPIVGLEPSCVSVFRDELRNLLPHDPEAMRLHEQVRTLAEFLDEIGYRPATMDGRAVVQGHCHHKSVMGMDHDRKLVGSTGLDADFLESGCCGMAGPFGFQAGEHYRVSVAAGERVLLPAVREAATQDMVVADGFSCRQQISQGTPRRALHLAQVLHMALEGVAARPDETPEQAYERMLSGEDDYRLRWPATQKLAAGLLLAGLAGAAGALARRATAH